MQEKNKDLLLKELGKKRQMDQLENFPEGYTQVEDHFPEFDEFNLVSPFTKSARNLSSQIMVVAQDWSSSEGIKKIGAEEIRLGYTPSLATNLNLHTLLKKHFGVPFKDVYATNLFVFIKPGTMSARIPARLFDYSALNYTSKEIEIVSPKLVICLGSTTYARLTKVMSGKAKDWKESLTSPNKYLNSYVIGVPHTGGLGTANVGGLEKVDKIWSKVADFYKGI